MFCFKVISLFVLVGSALSWTAPNYDLANAEQHFVEFMEKYNRSYESFAEYSKRLAIFTENLKQINEWNELYKSEKGGYAVGPFADLEKVPSCLGPNLPNNTNAIKVNREFIVNAPDALDYRKQNLVTGVKDQGKCGTCFVFAAIGNIEGMHAKQTSELLSLSEQQGFDCTHVNCKTGGLPKDVMNVYAQQGGCESEDDYPYTATPGTCHTDKSKIKVKVTGGNDVGTPDVESFKGALVQNGAPLATTFFASPQFCSAVGNQVLNPTDCTGSEPPNHAVLIVGYGKDASSGAGYWIIKNSWGTSHGDGGYFYLDFNNRCAFGQHTATASVS